MIRDELNNEFVVICLLTVFSLTCYTLIYLILNKRIFKLSNGTSNEYFVYLQRFFGVLLFGLIPVLAINIFLPSKLDEYGLILNQPIKTAFIIILLSILIVPFSFYYGKSAENLKKYPQIRSKIWNFKILAFSALTWIFYLFAYEFFFRGMLLFACAAIFGQTISIIINVVVYSLAHIPKGKLETIGAVPFGIILCSITFYTGSIWAAFGTHVIMALSSEWISLHFSKEIRLKWRLNLDEVFRDRNIF